MSKPINLDQLLKGKRSIEYWKLVEKAARQHELNKDRVYTDQEIEEWAARLAADVCNETD